MGGTIPLGYDPHPDKTIRGLIVVPKEAKTIKALFQLYEQMGCLRKTEIEAQTQGLQSKPRNGCSGKTFSRGAIHKLLTNRLYLGQITHKDKFYPGQHKAIVDQNLWDRVQQKLQAASGKRRGHVQHADSPAWLKGRLFDDTGDRMTPSHTKKNGRILRYYISNRLIRGKDPAALRLPALQIEQSVEELIICHLEGLSYSHKMFRSVDIHETANWQARITQGLNAAREGNLIAISRVRRAMQQANIGKGVITILLDCIVLAEFCTARQDDIRTAALTISAPFQLKRRGVETKILCADRLPEPDATLLAMLIKAHLWADAIRHGNSIADISRTEEKSESYIRTRLPLAFLSPRIQSAIVHGSQPTEMTLKRITSKPIPLNWQGQEVHLGF